MELTYMVRGGDGKEYGPVTLGQVGAWIREGRLTPKQEVKRSDMEHWARGADFAELQPLFAPASSSENIVPPPGPVTQVPSSNTIDPMLFAHMKSGASWFYWIAGLSLINVISAYGGFGFRFIFGLGITDVVDQQFGSMRTIAFALNLLAAGFLVLVGFFSHKGQSWAFVLGILFFALDGLLFLFARDWLGVAVHAFVLFFLVRGFVACRKLGSSRPAAG